MKLSDYVAAFLVEQGIQHIFLITGGAAVHLVDSIAKNPGIEYICTQHEQAAAMAAEAYSRVTENLGAALTTSGPGATNLVTGVCCAYFDSIPMILITGQVPTSQLTRDQAVRQIGFQETDVTGVFKTITKSAVLADDPQKIRYLLEQASYLAKSGRPGPVLVDIPDDVQRAEINPDELESFAPEASRLGESNELSLQVDNIIELIKEARRPVVIFGGGIRLAKVPDKVMEFMEKTGFPVALTWATMDMFPHDHPQIIGGFGVTSPRWGNFAVQNSDLILAIGTRLDTHETGNNLSSFAREAKKVVIDIDKGELDKYERRGMNVDIIVHCDVKVFFDAINNKLDSIGKQDMTEWTGRIEGWRNKYPICPPQYFEQEEKVNPYVFMDCLSEVSSEGDIIITDAGATLTWTMQGFKVKKNQRLFSAFNHSPMGYALPASIGAAFARGNNATIICVTGDGGMQMNIQELATIERLKLPIKIFLINNRGYGMVRQTQDIWLDSRYEAASFEGGLALPDFVEIAGAYGIRTETIRNHQELRAKIRKTLDSNEAVLCNVELRIDDKIIPKLTFGKPIEDSAPLLDRKEFLENMIVEPVAEAPKGS